MSIILKPGDEVWTTRYLIFSSDDPGSIYAERVRGVVVDDHKALFGNYYVHLSQCSPCEKVIRLDDPDFPVLPGPRRPLPRESME